MLEHHAPAGPETETWLLERITAPIPAPEPEDPPEPAGVVLDSAGTNLSDAAAREHERRFQAMLARFERRTAEHRRRAACYRELLAALHADGSG